MRSGVILAIVGACVGFVNCFRCSLGAYGRINSLKCTSTFAGSDIKNGNLVDKVKESLLDPDVQPYVKEVVYDQMIKNHDLAINSANMDIKRLSSDLLSAQGRLNARGVVEYMLRNVFYELWPLSDKKKGKEKPLSSLKFQVQAALEYANIKLKGRGRAPPHTQRLFNVLANTGSTLEDLQKLYEKLCRGIHERSWEGPGVAIDWSIYSASERELLTEIVEDLDLVVTEVKSEAE